MKLDKEAKTIVELIEQITRLIIENPNKKKVLLQMRSHLEKAVRLTGNGVRREWKRPEGVPIFQHERKAPSRPIIQESTVLADNSEEQPLKKQSRKKADGNI